MAGVASGAIGFIALLFLYGMWFATSASSGINRGLFYTFLFAIFLGIILIWQTAVTSIDQEIKRLPAGSTNICRLSEEAFEVTHATGVTVRIPWQIIKLEQETDQAFHIVFGEQRLAVFKKPLSEANAEGEFRSRIQPVTGLN